MMRCISVSSLNSNGVSVTDKHPNKPYNIQRLINKATVAMLQETHLSVNSGLKPLNAIFPADIYELDYSLLPRKKNQKKKSLKKKLQIVHHPTCFPTHHPRNSHCSPTFIDHVFLRLPGCIKATNTVIHTPFDHDVVTVFLTESEGSSLSSAQLRSKAYRDPNFPKYLADWHKKQPFPQDYALFVRKLESLAAKFLADCKRPKSTTPLFLFALLHALRSRDLQRWNDVAVANTCPNLVVSTTKELLTDRWITNNVRRVNDVITKRKSGWLLFVDFSKAYDSINRDALIEILKAYGFQPGIVSFIKTALQPYQIVSRIFDLSITVERGVPQGWSLSCVLFNLVIDPLLRHLQIHHPWLFKSAFADDLGFSSVDWDDLLVLQKLIDEYGGAVGLSVNQRKCAIISLEPKNVYVCDLYTR